MNNLQIAQNLWKEFKLSHTSRAVLKQHLADCKMFLKFLTGKDMKELVHEADIGTSHYTFEPLDKEISDLQSAIKFYKEKGVGK